MRLNEWQYMNTNKSAASTSNTSSGASKAGFKERFLKLLTFHIMHRKKTVVDYKAKTLTDDSLLYVEHHKNPATGIEYDVEYSIYIEKATEAWRLIVRKDGKYPDDLKGTGWTNLLRELRPYMSIPTVGTPEYNKLLKETSIAEEFKVYEKLWD